MPKTPAPFTSIAQTSADLRATAGRSAKVALLARVLASLSDEERKIAVDWLSGSLPQGRLGVGWAALSGVTAAEAQRGAPLTVRDVDEAFEQLSKIHGSGSRERRQDVLARLLARATSAEAAFLEGLLLGNLRQGASRGLMLEALAVLSGVSSKQVRRAHTRSGSVTGVLQAGASVELFQPLAPMLAGTAKNVEDALARLAPALVEAKADGARVQVHRRGGEVRVFTRNGNDISKAVPEIVERVRAFPGGDLILDGEALVWTGARPSPFQVTMGRLGARGASEEARRRHPLRALFFDCLMEDGVELLDMPFAERRKALCRHVEPTEQLPSILVLKTGEVEEAQGLLTESNEAGFEGVIVKSLSAPYAAGRRGSGWLKVKPVLTLDLVVLAAEWGSGRRTGWLSNLHLGARNAGTGEFVMLGKTFKGMTDALLTWQTDALQVLETRRHRGTVWVRPELVVEIAFDGVQTSRKYPGGVTLRFARLKRYRPDKKAEEADTIEAVRALLRAQAGGDAAEQPEQGDLFDASS